MKFENTKTVDDAVYYGNVEEPVVRYLESHLKCLEEDYNVEFFLEEKEDKGSMRRLGIDFGDMDQDAKQEAYVVMQSLVPALLTYGRQQYIELQLLAKKKLTMRDDPLTGLFTADYLMDRAYVLNRAEIFPTTIIAVKLKFWKDTVKNLGKESGDILVQLTASILGKTAEKDYLIGRMTDDVFAILIPLVKRGETESYLKRVDEECRLYKDSAISPALAMGITATSNKNENVQEKIKEAMAQLPQ